MFDDLQMFVRYGLGLRRFLKTPLTLEEGRRTIAGNLQNRGRLLLQILKRGVFENPASPFRKLLRHAGVEFGDLVRAVEQDGVEASLERLYQAGVYLSYHEFKGLRPIERGSFTCLADPKDFDNPLLAKHYEASTGASRGVGTRIPIDFDHMAAEAAYFGLFLTTFNLHDHAIAMWRPLLPAVAGIKHAFEIAKLGKRIEKFFSTNPFRPDLKNLHYYFFTALGIYGSRLVNNLMAVPQFIPLDRVSEIARWLESQKGTGRPALLLTTASGAVRICRAALDEGRDISGTFFRLGGEPYTDAKAKIIAACGCRAATPYAMAEMGFLGVPCGAPVELDDVHLLEDKLAITQHVKRLGASDLAVGAVAYTSLRPTSPKILLNVESADYGIVEGRDCGCVAGQWGLRRHIREIRSYDKLTSEGMTFLGGELIRLAEEILPRKFGGYPTDYQFVEEEQNGLSKIQIRVSPSVGTFSENALIETVLAVLRSYPGAKKLMSDRWREADTLRVVRAEPIATLAAKTLPLHILSKAQPKAP